MGLFKTILYCTDFSPTADHAFEYALQMAQIHQAALILFHSVHQPLYPVLAEPFVMTQVVEQQEDRLRREAEDEIRRRYLPALPGNISWEIVVRSGTPSQEILRTISEKGVDLVIMGARGRSPLELLMFGSVAHRVVKRSPVPVLTVSAKSSG